MPLDWSSKEVAVPALAIGIAAIVGGLCCFAVYLYRNRRDLNRIRPDEGSEASHSSSATPAANADAPAAAGNSEITVLAYKGSSAEPHSVTHTSSFRQV